MKKINLIFVIVMMLLVISSCQKTTVYQIGEERSFIDEIYKYIDSNKKNYCLVDVRDLDNAFAKGHFRGFINYDIEKGNMDEFIYRIESMYSKDKTIFIIDEDGSWVQQLQQALKKAKYKVVWKIISGKKNISIKKKGKYKQKIQIKGKKIGKAKLKRFVPVQ